VTQIFNRVGGPASRNWVLLAALAVMVLMIAEPAMAQDINLDPIQNFLQGLVDALTGPLGMIIATLALIGVFITWFFGIIDFRQAMWVVIAIAGIGGATTMVQALWA
jgi:type IV secretion system protein VirB2|tara:strand:- start:4253 stop:4573 length:321 start_codon:yes stop_codon:yes gene_type:complete